MRFDARFQDQQMTGHAISNYLTAVSNRRLGNDPAFDRHCSSPSRYPLPVADRLTYQTAARLDTAHISHTITDRILIWMVLGDRFVDSAG